MDHCGNTKGPMQCTGSADCGCECTDCRGTRDQHSAATYAEGREAPKREGGHGFTPTPGVVPCESFRDARAGGPGALYFCDVHIEDPACWHCGAARSKHGPDIEACARAAYEASWRHDPAVLPWDLLGDDLQDRAREVARAVLVAAARGGK